MLAYTRDSVIGAAASALSLAVHLMHLIAIYCTDSGAGKSKKSDHAISVQG